MLRLTVTVVQVMSDAHVMASVWQEDDLGRPAALGDVRCVYDMSDRLESYDELTALASVLRAWADDLIVKER